MALENTRLVFEDRAHAHQLVATSVLSNGIVDHCGSARFTSCVLAALTATMENGLKDGVEETRTYPGSRLAFSILISLCILQDRWIKQYYIAVYTAIDLRV